MPVKVEIAYDRSFESHRSPDGVIQFLTQYEKAITGCFPKLQKFEKIKPDLYRWEFKKLNYGGVEIQIEFVTRFEATHQSIEMHSEKAPFPSTLSGGWFVSSRGNRTSVQFKVKLETELPIPFFLKSVATPVAKKEVSKVFDQYIQNVEKVLSE